MKLKDNFYTIENATHDADNHVFDVRLNPVMPSTLRISPTIP